MKKKNKWFKKGEEGSSSGFTFSMAIGLLIFFIFAALVIKYLVFGANDKLDTTNSCGVLTGTKGLCKATCDKSTELELPNFGCSDTTNKCCMLKNDDMKDVLLPVPYGERNNEYDFNVLSIEITGGEGGLKNSGCKKDGESLSSLRCTPGSDITLPITITVENIGSNLIKIRANPVVVVQDNGDKITSDKYLGEETSIPISTTTQPRQVVTTTIKIKPDEIEGVGYWKIYPYALCNDNPKCTNIDTEGNRGILRREDGGTKFLTILFVKD